MRHRGRHLALSTILGLSAIGGALVVPAASLAATTASPTTSTATATCDEERWPLSAEGQPVTFRSGARAGDYIWHSATGWHIRFTHASSSRVIFSGRIVSDAALTVTPYRLEPGDTFTLSADHKTVTYRVRNYGHIDGLDFRTACASRLTFGGSMDGVKLPTGRIWIGRAGRHPLQNPFVILRHR
jgi:hypothetical protein